MSSDNDNDGDELEGELDALGFDEAE